MKYTIYPPHLMVEERRMMVRVRQVMQTAHRQDTYLISRSGLSILA